MSSRERPRNRRQRDDESPRESSWTDSRYTEQDEFDLASPGQLPDWSRRRPLPDDTEDRPLPSSRQRERAGRQPETPRDYPSLRETLNNPRRARSRIPDPSLDQEYERPVREAQPRFPSRQRTPVGEARWDQEEPVEDFAAFPTEEERFAPPRDQFRQRRHARTAAPRPRPTLQMPAAISTFAAAQDRSFLATIGVSAVSILFMIVTVSARVGSLPEWIVTHLDASGRPDQFGTASTVWRVPVMAFSVTAASFVAGFALAKRDLFLARFLVSSTLLVQALAWIALIRILW